MAPHSAPTYLQIAWRLPCSVPTARPTIGRAAALCVGVQAARKPNAQRTLRTASAQPADGRAGSSGPSTLCMRSVATFDRDAIACARSYVEVVTFPADRTRFTTPVLRPGPARSPSSAIRWAARGGSGCRACRTRCADAIPRCAGSGTAAHRSPGWTVRPEPAARSAAPER